MRSNDPMLIKRWVTISSQNCHSTVELINDIGTHVSTDIFHHPHRCGFNCRIWWLCKLKNADVTFFLSQPSSIFSLSRLHQDSDGIFQISLDAIANNPFCKSSVPYDYDGKWKLMWCVVLCCCWVFLIWCVCVGVAVDTGVFCKCCQLPS